MSKKVSNKRKESLVDTASDLFFDTIAQGIHEDFGIKNEEEFKIVREALVNYLNAMDYDSDDFG